MIRGIHHVALNTPDLERLTAFYHGGGLARPCDNGYTHISLDVTGIQQEYQRLSCAGATSVSSSSARTGARCIANSPFASSRLASCEGTCRTTGSEQRCRALPHRGDGSPELWIDGPGALQRLVSAPEYLEGAHLDERNFMAGDAVTMLCRTRLCYGFARQRTTPGAKVMFFFPVAVATDPQLTVERWEAPTPWLLPASIPIRLERATVLLREKSGGIDPPYGAIESTWWPDVATVLELWQQRPAGLRPRTREQGAEAMFVREELVLVPAAAPLPR